MADSPAPDQVLDVSGVTKRYGARVVLDRVSLSLGRGQALGLVGGNGGGKTTCLRILAGILRPDEGGGRVLGFDLRREAARIRTHVAYMSQRLSPAGHLTVLEHLRYRARLWGLPRPDRAADAAMEAFELAPHTRTRASELSGGWARRLQLAAAIIHEPALLLLDEPTAGLDAPSRQDVWQRLAALAGTGRSVVISTHDLAEAEWCTTAAYFAGGRVVAAGAPRDVAARAPAVAFVLSGVESLALARLITPVSGVHGAYPQGDDLRVVADPAAEDDLMSLASAAGARVARVPLRLADAALAFRGPGAAA